MSGSIRIHQLGKTTQLGTGLGLIQGAKLARRDWHAINVMGDAAIGIVGMDFETDVRNKIGTLTIVLKNSLMGGYLKYHSHAAERYQIQKLGGNYADMVVSLGGYGESIAHPGHPIPAIERGLEQAGQGTPALPEVITCEENRIPRTLPQIL